MHCLGLGGHQASHLRMNSLHHSEVSLLPQALVDRPEEIRRVINFKRLAITDLKVDIPRLAKKKVLKEALETSGACHTKLHCFSRFVSLCVVWKRRVGEFALFRYGQRGSKGSALSEYAADVVRSSDRLRCCRYPSGQSSCDIANLVRFELFCR